MRWITNFSALIAAIIWLVGFPLVMFAFFASYFWFAALYAVLGLALIPVISALRHRSSARLTMAIRISGIAVSITLAMSGIGLALATLGRPVERAPDWLLGPPFIAAIALFIWIGLASFALRGSSSAERAVCWLGFLTAASFLLPILASLVLSFVVRGFVYTNLTILPFLLAGFLLWVSLPAWLAAVLVRMGPDSEAQRTATARPS